MNIFHAEPEITIDAITSPDGDGASKAQSILEIVANDETDPPVKGDKEAMSKENENQEEKIGETTEEGEDVVEEKKNVQKTVIKTLNCFHGFDEMHSRSLKWFYLLHFSFWDSKTPSECCLKLFGGAFFSLQL